MTLMLDGQTPPEPEAPKGAGRRRYLVILGMVVALILAGGSAAYLLLSSSVKPNHGHAAPAPPPVADGATPDPSDVYSATGNASAAASASASASRSTTPSRSSSAGPTGGPGAPAPVTYHVPGDLCTALDVHAIEVVAGGPGHLNGDHKDGPNRTDYTCVGTFGSTGKVKMTARVSIFTSAAAATASYDAQKSGTDHVPGVGTDATGSLPTQGGYLLLAVDGNLEFKIQLTGVGGKPTPGELRQPAIDTIRNTLPRLRA